MLVLDARVLGSPAATALTAAFAQLQPSTGKEQEHGTRGRDDGNNEDDEDRSGIHGGNVPADRSDKHLNTHGTHLVAPGSLARFSAPAAAIVTRDHGASGEGRGRCLGGVEHRSTQRCAST
jgi:hypothetical protein